MSLLFCLSFRILCSLCLLVCISGPQPFLQDIGELLQVDLSLVSPTSSPNAAGRRTSRRRAVTAAKVVAVATRTSPRPSSPLPPSRVQLRKDQHARVATIQQRNEVGLVQHKDEGDVAAAVESMVSAVKRTASVVKQAQGIVEHATAIVNNAAEMVASQNCSQPPVPVTSNATAMAQKPRQKRQKCRSPEQRNAHKRQKVGGENERHGCERGGGVMQTKHERRLRRREMREDQGQRQRQQEHERAEEEVAAAAVAAAAARATNTPPLRSAAPSASRPFTAPATALSADAARSMDTTSMDAPAGGCRSGRSASVSHRSVP